MKANKKFTDDEEAVSPVIGVILMVAITVILAAVIAAFVFGMGGNLKKNYVVAATASQVGTDILVTYQGGPDHDEVIQFTISAAGTNTSVPVTLDAFSDAPAYTIRNSNFTVGLTQKFVGAGTGGHSDPVVATVRFKDGTEQVVLNTVV